MEDLRTLPELVLSSHAIHECARGPAKAPDVHDFG